MKHSRHYKWQTRWHIDRAVGIATHDTGAVVRIVDGRPIAQDPANIIAGLAVKNGHNASAMLERMLREVARLWSEGVDHGAR